MLQWIELELEALTFAKTLDIDQAEAILRSEMGESVTESFIQRIKKRFDDLR